MKNYTISEKRYKEIENLHHKFTEAEEVFKDADTHLSELEGYVGYLESCVSVTQTSVVEALEMMNAIRDVLFHAPIAEFNEETEMQKLVRTSGLSAAELNRIVGGE
tara:strand:+ start:251 stop:568 length:318 start_codon:yes stop_codon:yes gene_type:complete